MWNETADHENGAGGWAGGESSFMTDRKPDSRATTLGDRLPVPVTISNLVEHFSAQDDKYVCGNFRFATVLTVGMVKEIIQDGTSFTYELVDPEDENMAYRALKYDSDSSSFENSMIIEGTRVRAIGKLKGFDGSNTIMLFNIIPLTDDKDYTIFQLEAEAARLFFEKNMNDKLKSDALTRGFQGMLALPKGRAVQQQGPSSSRQDNRIYPVQQPKQEGASMRERVIAILKAVPEDNREEGSNVGWIAEQLGEKNLEIVRNCMSEMIENGLAYTTVDDETYSVI